MTRKAKYVYPLKREVDLKNLQITITDSDFDNEAAREKILRILRKEHLLGDRFLYRGFPKTRIEHLHKHGLDHPLTEPTFASTDVELATEDWDYCAVSYALRGGCLAVFSKEALEISFHGCYLARSSMFPEALIAIVLLDGRHVGDKTTGVLEDLEGVEELDL